ncbi:type VII secretion protein EccE [Nocardia brasiliensis]|uniref:type VII secretion protein EccE n=1 Tax=Nocardia brasiliensis TaxID=37326 RepID=UPI00142D75AA|nr:type VII secretion protein EccE [Nocardia brasiliensis]
MGEIPAPRPRRRTPFEMMPLTTVLPCAAAGATAATSAIALDAPLWAVAGTGVGVCALGAARWGKTNVWRILALRTALWWRNRGNRAAPERTEPFDVPVPDTGGDRCGMRWDGSQLITMLALDRTAVAPTRLDADDIHSNATVAMSDVARCLAQFDIRLAAIDVVTLGVRTSGPHNVVEVYQKLLGPLPAAADRTVWLVLRFDPLDNTVAIAHRGGGEAGMIRTALVAARRVASRLTTRGVRVALLSAAELAAAEASMSHDTDPAQWTEDWRLLRGNGIELAGYAIPATALDSDVLSAVWALPGKSVLTRLRLTAQTVSNTPGERGAEVAMTALVRQDTSGATDSSIEAAATALGLLPLRGAQRRILLDGGHLDPATALSGPPGALARFTVPIGGCGQVIGATVDGAGVAVPLFGPAVRRAEIVGSLWLAQLMVLRAVAVGAMVVVHSVRSGAWEKLVDEVGAPAKLSIASTGGSHRTAVATMIVYDGVASAGHISDATAVYVRDPEQVQAAGPDVDVALIESADTPGEVVLRTAAGSLAVRLVSITEEHSYLGRTTTEAPVPVATA